MSPSENTRRTLEALGYPPHMRLVILHADDVGMCHAENAAFVEHAEFGITRCGAIMAPCPWVPEIAQIAQQADRTAAHAFDLGAHITLTSEWRGYRWRPLSTSDKASGLLDEEGYLWRSVEALHDHVDPQAAATEMRAQVEHLLSLGVDLTHIDTHMGAVILPELLTAYVELAYAYQLPAMVPRFLDEGIRRAFRSPTFELAFGQMLALAQDLRLPLVDYATACLHPPEGRVESYIRLIDALPPGITHLLFHAAKPGDELRSIAPDWPYRVADYEAFLSPTLRDYLQKKDDVAVIGYRLLRDLLRSM